MRAAPTPTVRTASGSATRPLLEIDTAAVAANTRLFAQRTDADLMAVKADSFGHGSVEVARTALANGARWLGVTSLDEALELRQAGIGAPVLSWLNPVDLDAFAAARNRVDLAVPSIEHLNRVTLGAARAKCRVRVHLDTGMARDGAAPKDWPKLCARARDTERSELVEVVGIMGHLPCADRPGHSTTASGLCALRRGSTVARAAGLRPALRHLASTAAVLTDGSTHLELVRVGAGLVGIDPSGTTNLNPALRLTAPVVQVRDVTAGTGVGYGHADVTDRPTTLGLIPMGYADGLPQVTHRLTGFGRDVSVPPERTIMLQRSTKDLDSIHSIRFFIPRKLAVKNINNCLAVIFTSFQEKKGIA